MAERKRFYISTVGEDAADIAREYGLGLELAEFCTAANMDDNFAATDDRVRAEMNCASRFIMHAPFNELYPAAIDPRARELAKSRILQAARLAERYGIRKLVVHSGYVPLVYYKEWHIARSVDFWREVLRELTGDIELCMENVMEDEPKTCTAVAEGVNDARFGLCLDIGHATVCSKLDGLDWLDAFAPYLKHVHIHNNDGKSDLHGGVFDGACDMERFIRKAAEACPAATFTIESIYPRESARELIQRGIVE